MSVTRYVYPGLDVDAQTVNQLLEELDKSNKLKDVYKRICEAQMRKHAIEKRPRRKYTSPSSSNKKGDRKLGYVSSNEEFYGLTVYENSNGRYVNDNGKRVDASRFKISKHKPY